MPRINILPPAIANLIAAGEVVERPASVVKELLENSFDAGARRIEVEIREGGMKYIAVRDNGLGMDAADLKLAVQRHATSKIAGLPDLDHITTMGFRGEALPSIAAVSRLLISSRTRHDVQGHQIVVHGGEMIGISPVGCPAGTFVCVQDLFYNTPARRKYLKSASAEAAAISDYITRLALARPDVSIVYKNNQRLCLQTPGSSRLIDVLCAVYGGELGRQMLPVSCAGDGLQLAGYISPPALQRSTPRYITTLVNQRYVRCRTILQALLDVYQSFLPAGRYPVAVLNLQIDPRRVDVNVHPAKMEIKLQDEQTVFSLVRRAVREALAGADPVPVLGWPETGMAPGNNKMPAAPAPAEGAAGSPPACCSAGSMEKGPAVFLPEQPEQAGEQIGEPPPPAPYRVVTAADAKPETLFTGAEKTVLPDLTPVGFLPPVYILATDHVNFYIIDHHAAHERILSKSCCRHITTVPPCTRGC